MSGVALKELFQSIDAKDADAFASFLTEDAVFRYGSQPPVQGRTAIRDYTAGFFGSIQALRHDIHETWEGDGSLACQGDVTYTMGDGSAVTIPFVNVFRFDGDRVREYLIHIDPTPLAGP